MDSHVKTPPDYRGSRGRHMGRLTRYTSLVSLAVLSLLGSAGAALGITPGEANNDRAKFEYCTATMRAEAPNSAANESLLCVPRSSDGMPGLEAVINQGTKAETQLSVSLQHTTSLERDPAAPGGPAMDVNVYEGSSDSLVAGQDAESYLRILGNPDGQGDRTIADNDQTVSNTVQGAAMANLTTTNHTGFTDENIHTFNVFRKTLRGVACDATQCDSDGDYPTVINATLNSDGSYNVVMSAYDVEIVGHQTNRVHVGSVEGRVIVNYENGVMKAGGIEITDHDMPGRTGELRLVPPRDSGVKYALTDSMRVSTSGQTSRTFDWEDDLLVGTQYAAVGGVSASCVPDDYTACFHDNRFSVQMDWVDLKDKTGRGFVSTLNGQRMNSAQSAVFSYFNNNNWEEMTAVLNGCPLNGHYWTKNARASNVAVTTTYVDHETKDLWIQTNPAGNFGAVTIDIEAFSCN